MGKGIAMDRREMVEKLSSMGGELESMIEEFDSTKRECDSCGATVYENREDFKSAEAMHAMITRLDKIITLQERGS